ncbi:MAG: peptidoglycan-binding protein [Oscillospiraceae bacterium]|nr:peptidoglycan-binding protein [Oscillospiraceae bacterium]
METLRIGSTGPLVELLQSKLKELGFLTGNIDGIFGNQTYNAVAAFQRSRGLIGDGIAGSSTWLNLMPLINGYDVHTVQAGDTVFRLANAYGSSIDGIIAANPGIDVYNLQIGQKLVVPLGTVVPGDISYSYDILTMNIGALKAIYPFIGTGSIGSSALCRQIPYMRLGTGPKEVFYNASFHANEWITTPVVMRFAENLLRAYVHNTNIAGYSARNILRDVSIYLVPMVNPDGVDLVTGAIRPDSEAYRQAEAISEDYPSIPFPQGWKANIRGTDLNLQFPANWEQAREIKFAQGFVSPAPRDYVGSAPLTAPESVSVYQFTLAHNFRLTLSYHTQGRVIYWQYLDYNPANAASIGARLSAASGYALEQTPYASSFAGYKDWFIQTYNRPGYTIEAGYGVNPLPISQFDEIYRDNEGILVLGAVLAP